jgi:very-short-patch-repair endonuclease
MILNIPIQILGTSDEPLIRASDVGLVLDITKIRNTIQDYDITEKVELIVETAGGPQKVTFLTSRGIKKVICKSRKPKAIKFAKMINLNIYDTFYIPFEISFVNFLQKIYSSEKLIHQYTIGKYKIDLYLPDYNLVIECDEHFHIFQKEEDIKREKYIKDKLNCTFIRFIQSKSNECLPELLNNINKIIEDKKLQDLRFEIMNLNTKLDI